MAHDALEIANWFVKRAAREGRSLSIMHLLKLIYIAHGWYLEMRGRPLISNRIEAWRYGPVIPEVYNTFRPGGIEVHAPAGGSHSDLDADTAAFLNEIYEIYGNMSAFRLSDLTHVPGGPWDRVSRERGHYAEIPDELIRQHYRDKRTEAANG